MLKKLQKQLNSYKKDESIFDIVIYGSATKGEKKPNDIDIVIICNEGTLRQRLEKAQEIKRKIETNKKIDIKTILWQELFQKEFFARAGIFTAGISCFENKPFANKIGCTAATIFTYNLKNKTHTEKIKFNYILRGRNTIGMIKRLKGTHVAPGVIQIPTENQKEFEEVLKKNKIQYKKKNHLIEM